MTSIAIIFLCCNIVSYSSFCVDYRTYINIVPSSATASYCSTLFCAENPKNLAGLSFYNSTLYALQLLLISAKDTHVMDVLLGNVTILSCGVYLRDWDGTAFYVEDEISLYDVNVLKTNQGLICSLVEGIAKTSAQIMASKVNIISSYIDDITVKPGKRKENRFLMGRRISVESCTFENVTENCSTSTRIELGSSEDYNLTDCTFTGCSPQMQMGER